MGWLDTLLTWLLALLDWVCWPCRLVEWLSNLDDAGATVVAGALNAGAILGAGFLAMRAAQSVLRQKSDARKFETAENILGTVREAERATINFLHTCKFCLYLDDDKVERLKSLRTIANDEAEAFLLQTAKISDAGAVAQIYHEEAIYSTLERFLFIMSDINFAYNMLKTISENMEIISDEIFDEEYHDNLNTLLEKNDKIASAIQREANLLSKQLKQIIG